MGSDSGRVIREPWIQPVQIRAKQLLMAHIQLGRKLSGVIPGPLRKRIHYLTPPTPDSLPNETLFPIIPVRFPDAYLVA